MTEFSTDFPGQPRGRGDTITVITEPVIDRVFVYGTLHPENPLFNWRLVEHELGVTEWHPAEAKGTRVAVGGPWDYVWFHEDGDPIQGAVLVIGTSENALHRLDRYEGYHPQHKGSLFIRKEITLADGTKAWGYEWGETQDEYRAKRERSRAWLSSNSLTR